MPVSLAEAQRNAQTDYDASIINEFRTNPILDLLTFDQAVNPAGGGATLTYGYRRQATVRGAAFRAINSEYTPTEATTSTQSVDLKVLGGSFQIDRVLARVGAAASGEVAFQQRALITGVQAKFGDAVINGDSTVDTNGFDGLSKALAGSSTEVTTAYDLTGTHDSAWGFRVLEMVDDLIALMDGEPTFIGGNTKLINLIKAAARVTSQYVTAPGPGNQLRAQYGNAVLVDMGFKADSTTPVVPINATDPDGAGPLVAGSTALYGVRVGLDGFHGVTTVGGQLVQNFAPDFTTPGAVKTGEVELGPVAVALKKTRAAAVLRNVKVQ